MIRSITSSHLEPAVQAKVEACCETLRKLESVVVAFSGGTDSAFLLALAVETLGRENVLAAMAVSTIFPQRERKVGREMAHHLGVELVEIETPELTDPSLTSPADRCYYLKTRLMHELRELAAQRGLNAVVSGVSADDEAEYRPGGRAEEQLGISRPLMEAGLTKVEIREAAIAMGLSVGTAPAVPTPSRLAPAAPAAAADRTSRATRGEQMLREMGFEHCRVRDHGPVACVEVAPSELDLAVKVRDEISASLKELGFTFVTLDLHTLKER